MHTILWVIQVILGIKLITVAYTHGLRQSSSTMREAMEKMGGVSQPLLSIIAALTFTGAAGLILPGISGSLNWLTPVTATILSIMLLSSIYFHAKYREKTKIFVSIILSAFAAFIAYGRWMLVQ